MCEPFWWSEFAPIIGPGFSKIRAAQLHRAGLRCLRDAWQGGTFLSANETGVKFGLKAAEYNAWNTAIAILRRVWRGLLAGINPTAEPGEWLGIFGNNLHNLPVLVFQAGHNPDLVIGAPAQVWQIPSCTDLFSVLLASRCLTKYYSRAHHGDRT
jgi:hypothetical protein